MEDLKDIEKKVKAKLDLGKVVIDFVALTEMKVTWERTRESLHIHISDYLQDAPAPVIDQMVMCIVDRIEGRPVQGYPQAVSDYILSDGFALENLDTYMNRADPDAMEDERLNGLHLDLIDKGLVSDIYSTTMIVWSKKVPGSKVGRTSVVMKTVMMNPVLKDADDDLLTFALYTQLVILDINRLGESISMNNPIYEALIKAYPGYDRYLGMLHGKGIYLS